MSTQAKRILITGGSGDLGRVLSKLANAAGHTVTATYLTRPERITVDQAVQVDLTDGQAVQKLLDEAQPEVIFHTALSGTTSNPRTQIVTAAYHLRNLGNKAAKVIFISTDMVFDGTAAPYRDNTPPSPITPYGQAKAEMELMADNVVRTSLIYDFEPGNRQVDWMLEKIAKKELCRLYIDEVRSPIWAVNLAEALLELMDSPYNGILNVAGPAPMTRVDLGTELLRLQGYNPAEHIETISQLGSGRQPDLTLDVSKAQLLLKTPLLSFTEARDRWQKSRSVIQAKDQIGKDNDAKVNNTSTSIPTSLM